MGSISKSGYSGTYSTARVALYTLTGYGRCYLCMYICVCMDCGGDDDGSFCLLVSVRGKGNRACDICGGIIKEMHFETPFTYTFIFILNHCVYR